MNTFAQDPVPADVGMTAARATDTATTTVGSSAQPLIDSVVRSAHDTVDRVAAKAAPAVERLVGGAHGASDAVRQRAREAGDLGHEWADSLRATVRDHPLASIAIALAVGVLVSRLAESNSR
jgi:ElaB/YqjD/DUF883 family membrane-anchored ribosome-binding protein